MVVSPVSERRVLAEALEREFSKAIRMMRAFPYGCFNEEPTVCPRTGRDLAWGFVRREHLLHYVISGRMTEIAATAPSSLHEILVAYEEARRETRERLGLLTRDRWNEVLRGPAGLGRWERARRGELLWMALRDLVHHGEHFALHLRMAREADASSQARESRELRHTA